MGRDLAAVALSRTTELASQSRTHGAQSLPHGIVGDATSESLKLPQTNKHSQKSFRFRGLGEANMDRHFGLLDVEHMNYTNE